MAYPSTIGSFTNPNPSDKLSSPSHSGIETMQNTALVEIENFVGVDGANSVLGTLVSDIRNPSSNGGGHIQGVNKGGTNITSYTKGDLLVATSASVLSKLAVGTDGQVLMADSNQQAGIKFTTLTSTGEWVYQSTLGLAGSSVVSFVNLPAHDFYKIRFDNITGTTLTSSVPNLTIQVNNVGASVYSRAYVVNGSTPGADSGSGAWILWGPQTATGSIYGFAADYTLKGKPTNSVLGLYGNGVGLLNDLILLRGMVTTASVISTITFIPVGVVPLAGSVELWYKDNS